MDSGGEAINTINSNYHDNAMEEYTNNYDGALNEMMPKLASAAGGASKANQVGKSSHILASTTTNKNFR